MEDVQIVSCCGGEVDDDDNVGTKIYRRYLLESTFTTSYIAWIFTYQNLVQHRSLHHDDEEVCCPDVKAPHNLTHQ